jgi:NAD(P)-dependent dehydrogenase (short-subunit alcohol dehydrogenase family)
MYGVSKLCEATYTRILADQLRARNVAVYACCPGCDACACYPIGFA